MNGRVVAVRLKHELYDRMVAVAHKRDMTIADWMREVMLRAVTAAEKRAARPETDGEK
jgi:predicted DNA-binding ribbon-helix-helix protein